MAVIELELTKRLFLNLVNLTVNASALIPMPTLDALGSDRLIRDLEWRGEFTLVDGLPGYTLTPGTLVVRAPLRVWHVSVAELRSEPNTFGTMTDATAWLEITTTPAEARVAMVAFAKAGAAPALLPGPVRIGALPLPVNGVAEITATALVWRDRVVGLRLATSPTDKLLGQWPSRLLKSIDEEGTGSTWLIHVPSAAFVEMMIGELRQAISPPPAGAEIEDAPTGSWRYNPMLESWGVHAHLGLKQIDACPGLFGEVDISVDVTVDTFFVSRPDASTLDLMMRVETDTSDWDSFRCWLGTGGVGPLSLLRGSLVGLLPPIASLVAVSESIRKSVGEQVSQLQVQDFTQTAHDGSWATFTRSFPISNLAAAVPFSIDPTTAVTIDGLIIQGQTGIFPPLRHAPEFVPARGPISGDWAIMFVCSGAEGPHCGHRLVLPEILISDKLTALGQPVTSAPAIPVALFSSSFAEPAANYRVVMPFADRPDPAVKIATMNVGRDDIGFAVVHSSAGLRAYVLGPHTNEAMELANCNWAAGQYCDSIHIPSRVIEFQEIKWVEPPPVYHFGESPLRQWQIVVEDVPETAGVRFMALRDGISEPLDPAGGIVRSGDRIWAEFVTEGDARLAVQVEGTTEQTTYRTKQRWLLPIAISDLPASTRSIPRRDGPSGRHITVIHNNQFVSALTYDPDHGITRPD